MSARVLIGLCLCLFAAGACNLPTRPQPGTTEVSEVDAVYTAAVQTVIAQLTLSAPTPMEPAATQPAQTPLPEPATAAPSPRAELSPSPAPAATATIQATELPAAPTGTAPASDPRAALGEPDWQDTLANSENWSLSADDNSRMEIEEGRLVMNAFKANQTDWWALTWPEVDDFYLETTGTFGECAERDRYGVIVRSPSDATQGYLFALSCDGRYAFWIMDTEVPKRTILLDWTASPHIRSGEGSQNRLGVWVEGNRFRLYANGELLDETSDDTLDGEHFGVFIGATRTEGFTVELDEIAYWDLP
jgi:hypothetical protein